MTRSSARSCWVQVSHPRPDARLRLICLPAAGGGASRYRDWPAHLPDDVEVVSVQLPGRESRFTEPPIESMEQLTGPLLDGLAGYLTPPFALFGHSMGALIAFELARRMRRMRPEGLAPVHLFASGCRAPHLPSRSPDRHPLPAPEFLAAVGELGGIPPELLAEGQLLEAMLPTLRSDFTLRETYLFRLGAPLSCPVSAFGGLQDEEVPPEDVRAWSRHTSGTFRVHLLPGGHFFVNSARAELLRLVGSELG
ncbi:MAG TPA: alpha/beta fold hydrolase [Pseudonocardiaceae bacterium]|nr:alpha/beta fold hydrolase [Pseudonocardiaceae bacterium]